MRNPDGEAINQALPTPLYHQIYLVLRDKIVRGELAHDDLLPGEQELGEMFGVSRITIKRALSELAKDGYVSRHRGRGTVVRFKLPPMVVAASFDGLLDSLKQIGLNTSAGLQEFEETSASDAIAAALELEKGELVQRAVRVRSIDGAPFSYLITHVPLDIGRTYGRDDLNVKPILALIEASGVKASSATQSITATAAAPDIAAALDTTIGAPLMKVRRVIRDETGRPIQHIVAYYRPDRYQYEMTMTRDAAEGDWRARA